MKCYLLIDIELFDKPKIIVKLLLSFENHRHEVREISDFREFPKVFLSFYRKTLGNPRKSDTSLTSRWFSKLRRCLTIIFGLLYSSTSILSIAVLFIRIGTEYMSLLARYRPEGKSSKNADLKKTFLYE